MDYFKQHEPLLFRFWQTLSTDQKEALVLQLQQIDLQTLEKQKQLLQQAPATSHATYEPFNDFTFAGNQEDQLRGRQLIEQGRVGCLLLAGGQGTRLRFSGPKGLYPLSIIKHKSLFQLCAEKVGAAGKQARCPLKLAIMTSQENDKETRAFFQQNGYYGLKPAQISFFVQNDLPFLDASGHLFLSNPWQVAKGPDGNGNSLISFMQSGILEDWSQQGIQYLQTILIDNPLADPFDAELAGFHERQKVDVSLKCTEKKQAEEKVGVLVREKGRCCVIEYSEMSGKEKRGSTG